LKKKALTKAAFLKRVRDTVKYYDMLAKGDRVLAAVSGGADSVCLLKALFCLRRELGIEIVVANMDHCLRGSESEAESFFVKKLAHELGLELRHKKVKVRSGGDRGSSLEEKARQKRYAFLKQAASRSGCNVIATGHTMDDQAETVLMRIIYGSSLAGISGIYPARDEGGYTLVRPLIRTARKEILQFLKNDRQPFVEDSSNRDLKYVRNRVRHRILPYLEKYNPRLKRSLSNLSDTLREDFIFLAAERKKAAGAGGGAFSVEIKDLVLQPKAIRKEVLKALFTRAGGRLKKLTHRHWMDMDYFIRTSEKGRSLDLPGGIRIAKRGGEVVFERAGASGGKR